MRRLLLISSSRTHGSGFLEHCGQAIQARLDSVKTVLFVPYALFDRDGYARAARQRFAELGYELDSIHDCPDPRLAVSEAEAIFVGGGNTFRLLNALHNAQLIAPIRERVLAGLPYIGSSAGTNMACPTIRTTNDMPIVEPPTLDALNVIPFQINPHYLDADPDSTHQGETREQRLREYFEENTVPVVGLREGSWLTIDDDRCILGGSRGAVLWRADERQCELPAETVLDVSTGHLRIIHQ